MVQMGFYPIHITLYPPKELINDHLKSKGILIWHIKDKNRDRNSLWYLSAKSKKDGLVYKN